MPFFIYRGSRPKTKTLGYSFDLNVPRWIPEEDENAVRRLGHNPYFEETDGEAPKPAEPPASVPVAPPVVSPVIAEPDADLAALQEKARDLGIGRVGVKSAERLTAEIAAAEQQG